MSADEQTGSIVGQMGDGLQTDLVARRQIM